MSELDSPLAGKARPPRLDAKDADTSGDIGLFDDATEDEAVSTEYSSAEEGTADKVSQSRTSESEAAEDDSDSSEWAPDAMDGGGGVTDTLKAATLEPATAKKATTGSIMVTEPPASPLQYKSRSKTSGAGELGVHDRRISFDNLFEEGWTDNVEDSTIIIPNKQARKAALTHAGQNAEDLLVERKADDIPKKKRR